MAKYDEQGREILDPTPVAMPVGFKRPPTLDERIRAFVRTELSRQAAEEGNETFEEADDFYVEEEEESPLSRYELTPMQEEAVFGTDRDDLDRAAAPGVASEQPAGPDASAGPTAAPVGGSDESVK